MLRLAQTKTIQIRDVWFDLDMIISTFKKLYGRRDLLIALTAKELKTRYKSAVLGFLWAFLNPLLQMAVLSVVFTFIVRIPVQNYPLFLFAGLLPWAFFSQSLVSGTGSLTANRDLIKKAAFPREILPISIILSNLINLLLSLAVLFPAMLIFTKISWTLALLPFVILLHVIFIVGIVLIASSLDIYYRDVSFIVQALTLAWFYLTPVIYPVSMVPERFVDLYGANPMVGIISLYRFALLGGNLPTVFAVAASLFWAAALFILGIIIFKKREPLFADWI